MQQLDIDQARLRYRYQPQTDPIAAAARAAYLAGDITEVKPRIEREDATIGNEKILRGIPVIGRIGGTITGTRPGDPSKWLED